MKASSMEFKSYVLANKVNSCRIGPDLGHRALLVCTQFNQLLNGSWSVMDKIILSSELGSRRHRDLLPATNDPRSLQLCPGDLSVPSAE